MRTKLLTALVLLATTSLSFAQERTAPTGRRFTNCMWPNPCGATGTAPVLPPKAADAQLPQTVPDLPMSVKDRTGIGDPLNEKIVEGRILDEENGGVVSALRVKNEKGDQIIYQGEPLRDAVGARLALPASKIPAKTNDAVSSPDDKDWNSVAMKTESAEQVNAMRSSRKALRDGSSESRTGAADRMWGAGRK